MLDRPVERDRGRRPDWRFRPPHSSPTSRTPDDGGVRQLSPVPSVVERPGRRGDHALVPGDHQLDAATRCSPGPGSRASAGGRPRRGRRPAGPPARQHDEGDQPASHASETSLSRVSDSSSVSRVFEAHRRSPALAARPAYEARSPSSTWPHSAGPVPRRTPRPSSTAGLRAGRRSGSTAASPGPAAPAPGSRSGPRRTRRGRAGDPTRTAATSPGPSPPSEPPRPAGPWPGSLQYS